MNYFNLKKLLLKPRFLAVLERLQEQLEVEIVIYDPENNSLLGQGDSSFTYQYSIQIEEQIIGWIKSKEEKASVIADVLNYIIQQEYEKKSLANETLEKYEEINFLYDISSRISTCLKVEEVIQVILNEVKKLIEVDSISVMLVNAETGNLETLIKGKDKIQKIRANKANFGIANHVLKSGKPEIINDVLTDHRYLPGTTQIRSLICAPLTIQNEIIGVINISHPEPMTYTTTDLKLFVSLASQVAAAIQTAQYYEQLKEYSQTLEQKVAERTLELETAKYELEKLATIDQLTQLANRRKFDEYLQYEWKRLRRETLPLTLILCDVDYFKLYNDLYGHLLGDKCLKKVARVLQDNIRRPSDLAARYGGEEFAVILSNTDGHGALKVAQRIHCAIQELKIPHQLSQVSQYVTVSLGIASLFPTLTNEPEDLIELADLALYRAKNSGRNCYIFNPALETQ